MRLRIFGYIEAAAAARRRQSPKSTNPLFAKGSAYRRESSGRGGGGDGCGRRKSFWGQRPHSVGMLAVWLIASLSAAVWGSPPENRLMSDLLRGYVVDERPVVDSTEPVVVRLGLILQQLIDLNERKEQLTVNMWLKHEWTDANLRWDPTEYENVTDVRFPAGTIWRPDILLYNSVDNAFDTTYKANLLAFSDGVINWIPPGIFTISCKLNIYYYPWDTQTCVFKFGSWSYSGRQIDLVPGDFSITEYMENGEWILLNVWVKREEKYYGSEKFQNVQFFLHLRRRTLYYAFNLIMPCVLTMILVVLGFTLNPFSCEKVGLQISVSLAICIFMTIMAEMTPQTSEAVPLLGLFFQSCMVISVLATGFTVYVQSVHFRCHSGSRQMGFWMRYLLLELLPFILRIQKPKQPNSIRTLKASLKERKNPNQRLSRISQEIQEDPTEQIQSIVQRLRPVDRPTADRLVALSETYRHVRTLREANEDAAEESRTKFEWQFAAIVVDRLCLLLFTLLMLSTGTMIMVKAPYLVA